jgi:hypothetical protein
LLEQHTNPSFQRLPFASYKGGLPMRALKEI